MFKRSHYTAFLFLSLSLLAVRTSGQQLVGVLRAGYATFSMSDLKENQNTANNLSAIPGRVVESFPGFLNYGGDFLFTHPVFFAGMGVGHTSTGGRVSYSDYSGSYKSDQVVHMTYANIQAGGRIISSKSVNIFLGMQTAIYFNTLDYSSEVIIPNLENSKYETTFHSTNIAFQPFVSAQRTIKKLFLKLDAGYEFHIPGDVTSNQDYGYPGNNTLNAKIQPNGLRASLGIGFVFWAKAGQ